jgi:acyl transferase domain-containing protein
VVGAIKTNTGHTEAAAGAAGVIKMALSLQQQIIPRLIHLKNLNPHLPSLEGKIVFPSEGPHQFKGAHNAGLISFLPSVCVLHILIFFCFLHRCICIWL